MVACAGLSAHSAPPEPSTRPSPSPRPAPQSRTTRCSRGSVQGLVQGLGEVSADRDIELNNRGGGARALVRAARAAGGAGGAGGAVLASTFSMCIAPIVQSVHVPHATPDLCDYGCVCSFLVNQHPAECLILLVTTVTEVSPPFRGVPQIWRSRSGYKSIAVSFCDQLVCSRLLATGSWCVFTCMIELTE